MSLDALHAETTPNLQHAISKRFPAFLGAIADSNPVNATPYLCTLSALRSGAVIPAQAQHVSNLSSLCEQLHRLGLAVEAIQIGGSALFSGVQARDLDAVLYYRVLRDLEWPKIRSLLQTAYSQGIDNRLVPLDGSSVLLLKAALYFGALYGTDKSGNARARGQLLVDCCGAF